MYRLLIGPELRQRSHCAACAPFRRFVNKYPHKLADYMLMNNIVAEHEQIGQTLRYLSAIAEQAAEGVAVIDLEGIIRFVNIEWARMHGCDNSNELRGRHISTFHTERQMSNDLGPLIEEAKHRGTLTGPIDHIRQDKTPFPTQTKIVLVKTAAEKHIGFVIFATDLTDRRHAEQRSRQESAELKRQTQQLQSRVTEYEQAEIQLKQHTEQLEQQLTQYTKAEGILQQQVAELTNNSDRLQQQLKQSGETEEVLKQQVAQLEADSEQLKNKTVEYEKLQCQFNQLQEHANRLSQKADELRTVNEQLENRTAEYEQIQAQIEQYAKQVEHQSAELAQLKAANQKLTERAAQADAANEQLKERTSNLKQLENELRTVQKQFDKQTKQLSELTQTNEQLEHGLSEYEQAEIQLQQHIEQLEQQLTQLSKAQDLLKEQIAELTQANEQLQQTAGDGQSGDAAKRRVETQNELGQCRKELEGVVEAIAQVEAKRVEWTNTAAKGRKTEGPLSPDESAQLAKQWFQASYWEEEHKRLNERREQLEQRIEQLAGELGGSDEHLADVTSKSTEAKFKEGRENFQKLMNEQAGSPDSVIEQDRKKPAPNSAK